MKFKLLVTNTNHYACYRPFSPSLFLSIDVSTSSGTVTRPSGVFTGSTLTGSHLIGTYANIVMHMVSFAGKSI